MRKFKREKTLRLFVDSGGAPPAGKAIPPCRLHELRRREPERRDPRPRKPERRDPDPGRPERREPPDRRKPERREPDPPPKPERRGPERYELRYQRVRPPGPAAK